jgi:sortase A
VASAPAGEDVTSMITAQEQDHNLQVEGELASGPGSVAGSRKARKPGRGSPPQAITIAAVIVAGIGALALWFVLYAFVLSGLQEHGRQARLYDRYRLQLATATAPLGGLISPGAPVALLSAPSAGLHSVVVVEGTTSSQLTSGPGHQRNTPLPGQAGTSVVLGRSVTFGGPFSDVAGMHVGDKITVTTGQGVFVFRVYDVRHPGSPLPHPLSANQAGLTLVTSASGGWRSGWAPSHPVYVDAVMVHGTVQPAPGGGLTTVSAASLPMQGNTKDVVPFVFWVEGLLATGALVLWSWIRWGRRQTWLVGVPVIVAMLWGTTNALMQLLPNLL